MPKEIRVGVLGFGVCVIFFGSGGGGGDTKLRQRVQGDFAPTRT